MKKIGSLLVVVLAFAGCAHTTAKPRTKVPAKTDEVGHVIKPGQDWSAAGGKQIDDAAMKKPGAGTSELYKVLKCGVPPTLSPEQKKNLPPDFDPYSAFPPPKNDFPVTATISPSKGDPGTVITIHAQAVGKPGALMVIFARFFDGQHHGLRAAQKADALGRVTFTGPIPKDAPVGLATIAVSASTQDQKSALKTVEFTVTGPGCR